MQRFALAHPPELRLARCPRLVQASLGHFEQLHTGSLPALHVPDGDRVEHYSGLSLLTTPLKRLRVAPENLPYAKANARFCFETNLSGNPPPYRHKLFLADHEK